MTLFTIGYNGMDIDRFIAILRKAGIQHLVDIRKRPLSRKKGFSKTKLGLNLLYEPWESV